MAELYTVGRDNYLGKLGEEILLYANEFGSFTKKQAYYMIPQKHYSTVNKVLKNLMVKRKIHKADTFENTFTSSPLIKFSKEITDAVWVMLVHKGTIMANSVKSKFDFARGTAVAPVKYYLDDICYHVIPLEEGSEGKSIVWTETLYEKQKERGLDKDQAFIFLVKNMDYRETLEKTFPDAEYFLAVINNKNQYKSPVLFYDKDGTEIPIEFKIETGGI